VPKGFSNGDVITVGCERFRAPELFFHPEFDGLEIPSVQSAINQSIMKSDADLRKDLFQNIVLSGCSSMFRGFEDRLIKEMTILAPPTWRVRVVAPSERKYYPWVGGSIFASMASFEGSAISKEQFFESGPAIIHRQK